MRALEKERGRRYESASSFADDIQRYLDDESVVACPPSASYILRKFVRRNKTMLLAGSLIVAAMVAGTTISVWQGSRATLSQQLAQRDKERAERAEKQSSEALRNLARQQVRTNEALKTSNRLAAELAFDKGQLIGVQGNGSLAMLWMARSLSLAAGRDADLEHVIRSNLGAWKRHVHRLQWVTSQELVFRDAALSPEGSTVLAVTRMDDGVRIHRFNVWDGRPNKAVDVHLEETASRFAFSSDTRYLAIATATGTVYIADTSSGETTEIRRKGLVTKLIFDPDGSNLLVARRNVPSEDSSSTRHLVELIDVNDGSSVHTSVEHAKPVHAAAFSADGQRFVTAASTWGDLFRPSIIRVFEVGGDHVDNPMEVDPWTLSVALHPDGSRLLTGHYNGAAVWQLDSQRRIEAFQYDGPVSTVSFSPHRNGSMILAGSYDFSVRLWDINSTTALGPPLWHGDMVNKAEFSADGQAVLTKDYGGILRLWRVAESFTPYPAPNGAPPSYPLGVDADRKLILGTDDGHMLRVQDVQSGRIVGTPISHETPAVAGAISSDGNVVVTIGTDQSARLWIQGELKLLPRPLNHAFAVAISPDGEQAVTGTWSQAIVWNTNTCEEIQRLKHGPRGPVFVTSFSRDGNLLLTGGSDLRARLWHAETLEAHSTFEATPHAASISADGRFLLSGSRDRSVQALRITDGELIGQTLPHERIIMCFAFSEDGRIVITGSTDHMARLWDVATGKLLGPPMPHPGTVGRVAFWYDETTILTCVGETFKSQPGPAHYWPLTVAVQGDPEQVNRWVQVITGMQLSEKVLATALDASTWLQHRDALQTSNFSEFR